ncbi:MAG: hypothetical protein Q7V16_04475, partial [Hydrogenophaga sp.]|nr:hypothetical protein [Hydrogenophaga sp.]
MNGYSTHQFPGCKPQRLFDSAQGVFALPCRQHETHTLRDPTMPDRKPHNAKPATARHLLAGERGGGRVSAATRL